MAKEKLDKPKIEEGIPGARVVAWLIGSMVLFPMFCFIVLSFARRVGQAEGTRFDYRAMRDPVALTFILLVLVACGALSWWMGRREKPKK